MEIQMGSGEKSFISKGLPNIWGNVQIFNHEEAASQIWLCTWSFWISLYVYEENFLFFFINVSLYYADPPEIQVETRLHYPKLRQQTLQVSQSVLKCLLHVK